MRQKINRWDIWVIESGNTAGFKSHGMKRIFQQIKEMHFLIKMLWKRASNFVWNLGTGSRWGGSNV